MGLFLMGTMAWVLFLVAISVATAISFPLMRRWIGRMHPAPRAHTLRALAMGPIVLASLGVLLCFAPKILGSLRSQRDHCFEHADLHPHFCLNHPPQLVDATGPWLGLALLATVGVVAAIIQWSRVRNSAQILRQLASTAQFDAHRRAWMVDSDLPVAISVGVLQTRTILSSGLLRVIPSRLVDAIVAHEHAHERRRDGLWRLITELLSFGHLLGTRRAIQVDLELACEQACDEEAGAALGDRIRVAEALVAMERVRQGMTGLGPTALAFDAHGLPARVESLVSDSAGGRCGRRAAFGVLAATVALAVAAADPLHHLTETLLHYVLG